MKEEANYEANYDTLPADLEQFKDTKQGSIQNLDDVLVNEE